MIAKPRAKPTANMALKSFSRSRRSQVFRLVSKGIHGSICGHWLRPCESTSLRCEGGAKVQKVVVLNESCTEFYKVLIRVVFNLEGKMRAGLYFEKEILRLGTANRQAQRLLKISRLPRTRRACGDQHSMVTFCGLLSVFPSAIAEHSTCADLPIGGCECVGICVTDSVRERK